MWSNAFDRPTALVILSIIRRFATKFLIGAQSKSVASLTHTRFPFYFMCLLQQYMNNTSTNPKLSELHELSNSLHNFIKWMRLRETECYTRRFVGHLNALHRSLNEFARELLQNPQVQRSNETKLFSCQRTSQLGLEPARLLECKINFQQIVFVRATGNKLGRCKITKNVNKQNKPWITLRKSRKYKSQAIT